MANESNTDPEAHDMPGAVQSESLRGWTGILLSVLLICLTAVLFGAGQGFRQGWLYQLGFDLAQVPSDFHDTLFWGFSGGTPLAVAWLGAAVVALPATGLLLWLMDALWKWASRRWRLLARISTPEKSQQPVRTHVKLILGGFLVLPVLYVLLVTYVAMAEFQKAGTKRGQQLIAALRADAKAASAKYNLQWIEILFNSPTETVVRGYRLLCTEALCSIYDPDPKAPGVRLVSLENLREVRVVDPGGETP